METEKETFEQLTEAAQMNGGKMDDELLRIISGGQNIREWPIYADIKKHYRQSGKNAAMVVCSRITLLNYCYTIIDEIEKDLGAEG